MTTTRRTLHATGASTLLAVVLLAGCADEESPDTTAPTTAASTPDPETEQTSAPQEEAGATASDQATVTDDAPITDGAASTEDNGSTSTPSAGEALASSDGTFTLEVPEGWEEALDLARENVEEEQRDSIVLAVKEQERKDEFFTNVVVTQEEYVGNLTSAVEETAEQLAGEDGEYELLDPLEVDGNLAPGYTVVRDVGGTTVHQTQRWISHEGTLYSVTFSAVDSQAAATDGQLDEMLASWSWQD